MLMGESMGGAVLMAWRRAGPPQADGSCCWLPAVWGRAQMGVLLSTGLWLVASRGPRLSVTGREVPITVLASDNREALLRARARPADHPPHPLRRAARAWST